MFNIGQTTAVRSAFRFAGFDGPLRIAEVTSEDECVFVISAAVFEQMHDVGDLEQIIGQLLGRKVWIVAASSQIQGVKDFG